MTADDLARRAKIPNARIYGILGNLKQRGCIRETGRRPTIYDALHPRGVIQTEIDRIQTKAAQEIAQVEQKWELRRDGPQESLRNGWSVSSYGGFALEVRRNTETAKRKIYIHDSDITWMTGNDYGEIKKAIERKVFVEIATSKTSLEEVQDLGRMGAKTDMGLETFESFYVFDDKRVLIRLHSPDGAISFDDAAMAEMLIKHRGERAKGQERASS